MHLLLAIIIGFLVFFKADLHNWKEYQPTILYLVCCNLLYNILCQNKFLWKYHADFLSTQRATELIYSFWILPLVALLYLSNFPPKKAGMSKKAWYVLKWIMASLFVELIYLKMVRIELMNEYKLWMEPFFYLVMYSMLRLHHKRPLLTYGFSVAIILFLMQVFHV